MEDFFEGWEGDPIELLLIVGKGKSRMVHIKTDRGKYKVPLAEIAVSHSSQEYSLPLYAPNIRLILIGYETELSVNTGKERALVEKVIRVAFARKSLSA